MKSEFPIWKTFIHNDCEHIRDIFSINDEYIPDLLYSIDTKGSEYISKGHHNLIKIFIDYFQYRIHDSGLIGNDSVKVNNDNFNEFRITDYYSFRRLFEAVILNPRPNTTTFSLQS